MLVSVAAYALIWGWKFAVGFVAAAVRPRDGPRASSCAARASSRAAWCSSRSSARPSARARSAATRSPRRASASPGRSSARSALPASRRRSWLATGDEFWQALAFTGFFLNLFNLLPVVPLDGGRAMAAMAPWMWFVGLGAMVALLFVAPEPDPPPDPAARRRSRPGGAGSTARRARRATRPTTASSPRTGSRSARVYVGLIVALGVGMDADAPRAHASATRSAARSISRFISRSLIDARLSQTSLPRASAISTLACGP